MAALTKPAPGWRLIIHGDCAETCPDASRQRDIMRGLQTVGEIAADTLKKGPKAKDVVVLAISAFEDFPMFNAGRGAALNRAGVHEVSSTLSALSPIGQDPAPPQVLTATKTERRHCGWTLRRLRRRGLHQADQEPRSPRQHALGTRPTHHARGRRRREDGRRWPKSVA